MLFNKKVFRIKQSLHKRAPEFRYKTPLRKAMSVNIWWFKHNRISWIPLWR